MQNQSEKKKTGEKMIDLTNVMREGEREREGERKRIKELLLLEEEILNVEVVRMVINKHISWEMYATKMRRENGI